METVNALPLEQDPRSQAVAPGAASSEYRLAVAALASTTLLALGAMALVALGRLDLPGLLVVLGVLLGGTGSAALVARGYAAERTTLKAEVARAAADVAIADSRNAGAQP